MSGPQIVERIDSNISGGATIENVQGIYLEGSMEGTDKLEGLIITMDDTVETQLRVYVEAGRFKVQLSQMEKVVTTVRKAYVDCNVPF